MSVTITTAAALNTSRRWDAKYHALDAKHAALAQQLAATFTGAELAELCEFLPFDRRAAEAVIPRVNGIDRTELLKWSKAPAEPLRATAKHRALSVYVAAAAQNGAAKMLERLVELAKAKLAIMNGMNDFLEGPAGRAPLLAKAFKSE